MTLIDRPDRSTRFDEAYARMLARFHLTPGQANQLRGPQRQTFESALTEQLIHQAGHEYTNTRMSKTKKLCVCQSCRPRSNSHEQGMGRLIDRLNARATASELHEKP